MNSRTSITSNQYFFPVPSCRVPGTLPDFVDTTVNTTKKFFFERDYYTEEEQRQ